MRPPPGLMDPGDAVSLLLYLSPHLILDRSLEVQWNSQSQPALREKQNLQKNNLRFKAGVSVFWHLLGLIQDYAVPLK